MPATPTPVGLLSVPLTRLAGMVAECPSFLAWTGATTPEEAQEHIHLLQSTREPALPLCLIDYGDGFERERVGVTMNRPFAQRGSLILYLRDRVDPDLDDRAVTVAFCNRVGALWDELERMILTDGRLLITAIALAATPTRVPSDRRSHAGDHLETALALTWQSPR